MTSPDLLPLIRDVLGRAPEWIRHDLEAKDSSVRRRAEEALAAMIGAAITQGQVGRDSVGTLG